MGSSVGGTLQQDVDEILRGTKWEYKPRPVPVYRRPRTTEFTVAGPRFDWSDA